MVLVVCRFLDRPIATAGGIKKPRIESGAGLPDGRLIHCGLIEARA
jgi:hypothetical protein